AGRERGRRQHRGRGRPAPGADPDPPRHRRAPRLRRHVLPAAGGHRGGLRDAVHGQPAHRQVRLRRQAAAVPRTDTWLMSFLCIGSFGSFSGYSFALPLLIKTQFPHVHGSYYAWMGALVGSLARPFGGWLSDRVGGARVTAMTFLAMGGAAAAVVV